MLWPTRLIISSISHPQARAHECIEQLASLASLLDAADEQHNDDSLMQYMLFSRC